MTAVVRAKVLVEALLDRAITPALSRKIIDRYILIEGVDIVGLNNEVKATAFLDNVKNHIKGYNMSAAVIELHRTNQGAEDEARDNAANDFT